MCNHHVGISGNDGEMRHTHCRPLMANTGKSCIILFDDDDHRAQLVCFVPRNVLLGSFQYFRVLYSVADSGGMLQPL